MTLLIKTPRAQQDLIQHFAYIALDKTEPATRFLELAEKTFQLVMQMPSIGKSWRSSSSKLAAVRVLPLPGEYRNYLVFYRRLPNGVEVIRVLHGARDLDAEFDTFAL